MLPLDKAKWIYEDSDYLNKFAYFLAKQFFKKEIPKTSFDYVNNFLNALYGKILVYASIGKIKWEITSIKKAIKRFLQRKKNRKEVILLIKYLFQKAESDEISDSILKIGDIKLKVIEREKPRFDFKQKVPVCLKYNRKTKSGILSIVGPSVYRDNGRKRSYFSKIELSYKVLSFGKVYILKYNYQIERSSFYVSGYRHSSNYKITQCVLIDTDPFRIALAYPIWYSDISDVNQLLKRIKPLNDEYRHIVNEIKKKIRYYLKNSF